MDKDRLAKALADSTLAYVENGDRIDVFVTREFDLAFMVARAIDCADRIVRSTQTLFRVDPLQMTKRLRATRTGEEFLHLIRSGIPDVKRYFSHHKLHPKADLLIDAAISRNLVVAGYQSILPNMPLGAEATQVIDALNGCINEIRKQGQSNGFRRKLDRFGRMARKNFQSLQAYINALADKHSRQLVLRIDLGYQKAKFWPVAMEDSGVPYCDVKEHRQKLMRYLSKKLPKDCMTGFALKLEFGVEKGYHYHLMLLLDGAKVREDVTIAKLIGEHWKTEITEGKGLYHNCNAFKGGYKNCGIGMFHHSDLAMREGLKQAAEYLTKTDCLIQLLTPDRDRTFWKGVKPQAKSGRGRPRTKVAAKSVKPKGN